MHEFNHLLHHYTALEPVLRRIGPLEPLPIRNEAVADSVARIVTGQMLSRTSADKIFARLEQAAQVEGHNRPCLLPTETMLACGLSRRKADAIQRFGRHYAQHTATIEGWRQLEIDELRREVSQHWGLSIWSADILAIFYFGLPDVFPHTDGAMVRALKLCQERYGLDLSNPEAARPYRTTLARYLWDALDAGVI
ncbi:MAG: hypothetical protein Q7P63_10205 [Verrucomicrobiota bacterium JB022]|nr:hypothetical protein [Verrucomicrobiota bacterium JB022]